jgi:hypothetical protein
VGSAAMSGWCFSTILPQGGEQDNRQDRGVLLRVRV